MNSKFLRGFGVAAALLIPAGSLMTVMSTTAGATTVTLTASFNGLHVTCTGTPTTTGGTEHWTNCHTTAGSGSLAATVWIGHGSSEIVIRGVPGITTCTVFITATVPSPSTVTITVTNATGVAWADNPTGCSGLTTGDTVHVFRP